CSATTASASNGVSVAATSPLRGSGERSPGMAVRFSIPGADGREPRTAVFRGDAAPPPRSVRARRRARLRPLRRAPPECHARGRRPQRAVRRARGGPADGGGARRTLRLVAARDALLAHGALRDGARRTLGNRPPPRRRRRGLPRARPPRVAL